MASLRLVTGIVLIVSLSTAAQTLEWSGKLGGPGSTYATAVAVDASGNTLTTGWFSNTADMDPGPGTANLTVPVGGDFDIHVTKLDPLGQFVWTRQLGGDGNDYARAIAVDAAGNVYVAGDFQGTADFDPGPNTFTLTSAGGGGNDVFVCKLDPAGNFVWAKQMGGTGSERGFAIAVNAVQEVYTAGTFSGTADFDPGTAEATLVGAGPDIFVSKLDAAGNFVWAKQMGGPGDDAAQAIALAANGDVLLTGYFRGTADFDPGPGNYPLVAAGTINESDAFVCRLTADGTLTWAGSLGGALRVMGNAIAVDDAGAILTIGTFIGAADFDPGPGEYLLTEPTSNDRDIYVSKLDGAGDFLWARQLGGLYGEDGLGVAVDAAGSAYLTGFFYDTADFDPGPGTVNLTAAGVSDAYITKLSTAGAFLWAAQLGGAGQVGGVAIATEPDGTVHATGFFFDTADLDPGSGVWDLTAPPGVANGYVLRLSDLSTAVDGPRTAEDALTVFPNPARGAITVQVNGPLPPGAQLRVRNAVGQVVAGVPAQAGTHRLAEDLAPGLYFVQYGTEAVRVVVE